MRLAILHDLIDQHATEGRHPAVDESAPDELSAWLIAHAIPR
jgi:hypothetical protein